MPAITTPADDPDNLHAQESEHVAPFTPFPIVGIGASAGGLEAFTQLLSALPANTGMAFVLIQHLDPTHESQLPSILARATVLPVQEIAEGMVIEPDSVYVVPPNATVSLAKGALHLSPRQATHHIYLPIDSFFESLAMEQGNLAIGVILSGNGSDGSLGLRVIKGKGGITFAQRENSAKFPSMPHSAIGTGAVDFVLSSVEIALELARLSTHPHLVLPWRDADDNITSQEDEAVEKIFTLLRRSTQVDFTHYKQPTMYRRIRRRMAVQGTADVAEYMVYLDEHPQEIQQLYKDLLISVTRFFRDPAAFETLADFVMNVPRSNKKPAQPFRIWVPGCASGEEVYSLAICLEEIFEKKGSHPGLQLFGTDISEIPLNAARAGRYPVNIAQDVSAERLLRFFDKRDSHYQIKKAIRDCCIFARQDVTRDPPFSKVDLISCRNTLIYLDQALQKDVIAVFRYSLNENGLLFLGPSETPGKLEASFAVLDAKNRIYARLPGTFQSPELRQVPRNTLVQAPMRPAPNAVDNEWRRQAEELIQNRYAPDGVIINQDLTILQVRGRTGYYLQSPVSSSSQNLLLLINHNLHFPLREAIVGAMTSNVPVQTKGLKLDYQGEPYEINLEVIPMSEPSAKVRHYFIIFEHTNPAIGIPGNRENEEQQPETVEQENTRLRTELGKLDQYVSSLSEEHETALEEQKASNEEISSANEELQSTNEELSTAREEIQAANEELTVVNQELQTANRNLRELAADLTNLFAAVDTPVLVVTRNLDVGRFTPAAARLFALQDADRGRPLSGVAAWNHVPSLGLSVLNVMENLNTFTQELQDKTGVWWSLTIRPYVTVDHRIEGTVLTFVNINSLKRSLELAEISRNYAEGIVDTVREPMVVLDGELRVNTASRAFYETFALSREKTEGQFIYTLDDGVWNIPALRALLEKVLTEKKNFEDFETTHHFPGLGNRVLLLNARQLLTPHDGKPLVLLAIDDATERKKLQDDLVASNEDLQRFAYAAAHDLRSPLHSSLRVSEMLAQSLRGKLDDDESAMLTLFVESMERLRRLMDDILAYSGVGHAQQRLELKPLAEPLNIALANLNFDIVQSKAQIRFGTLPELPLDVSRVAMVFQNLIDNAIKYRGAVSPQIDIEAKRTGQHWQISVRDNGEGFDPQYADRAFLPFKRLSESSVSGSGIGLATCKRIIERMGGRIWAESKPGKGSCFYFTLPHEQASATSNIG